MNDVEMDLGPQLHRLADELAPDADPLDQVGAARSRYRRQRRNRVGMAALAAATAAVVIGVPTALGSISSAPHPGDVAGPPTTTTEGATSDSATSAGTAPADAAEAQASQAEAAARAAQQAAGRAATGAPGTAEAPDGVATDATVAAALAAAQAQLGTVPRLAARVGEPLHCPSGAQLAGVLDGAPLLQQGTPGSAAECRWQAGTGSPGASASIGLVAGTFSLAGGGDGVTSGCRVAPVADGAALQRCVDGGQVTWVLYTPDDAVADAGGVATAGTWQLTVTDAPDQPQLDPTATLAALVELARTTWGG